MPQGINPLVAAMMAGRGGQMTIGRGLNSLGAGLAAGIMGRNEQKKLMEAMQGLAGPEMDYETTPPIATMGQSNDLEAAMSGAVNQDFTPEQRQAAMAQSGPAAGAIRDNTRGVVAGANDQRSQLIKMAMMPGKVGDVAKAKLLEHAGMMPKPPALRGAQKYMNLSKGLVLNMEDETLMDFTGKLPRELKALSPGDVLVDDSGKEIYTVPKGDTRKQWQTEIGAGDGMMTKAIAFSDGETIPIGKKYSEKSQIETTSGDPIKSSKPYRVRMELDREVLNNARVRLTDIGKKFQPFYQTYLGKVSGAAGDFTSKLGLLKATPEKFQEYVTKFKAFQQDVNANVNLYIKEITGAQMSEAEAGRLMKAMANLQDSPDAFESKLNNSGAQLDAAIDRKEKIIRKLLDEDKDMDYDKANALAQRVLASEPTQAFDSLIDELESGVKQPQSPSFAKGEDGVWRMEE